MSALQDSMDSSVHIWVDSAIPSLSPNPVPPGFQRLDHRTPVLDDRPNSGGVHLQSSDLRPSVTEEVVRCLLEHVAHDRSEPALRELYEILGPKVLAVLRPVLKSPEDALDILQEVFVLVWDKAPLSYRSDGNAMAWILQLAKNRAIDEVRSRRGRQDRRTTSYEVNQQQPVLKQFAEDNRTPEFNLTAKETGSEIQRALSVLSPIQRSVIDLIYFRSRTYDEAARELGIPSGSVSSHMRQAMTKLGKILRPRMGVASPKTAVVGREKARFVRGAW